MNTTSAIGVLLTAGFLASGCEIIAAVDKSKIGDGGLGGSGGSTMSLTTSSSGSGGTGGSTTTSSTASSTTSSTGTGGTGGSMPGISKVLLDYEFNVPGTTEPDQSGNGFNGTLVGLGAGNYVQVSAGNDALNFGGTGWVSVGVHTALEGMNQLKLRARVKSDSQQGFAPIISDWAGSPTPWSFFTNMDGSTTSCQVTTTSGNQVVVGGTQIFGNASGYHDVECVYDGAQVYLTIDGQQQADVKALSGTVKKGNGFVGVGALYDQPTQKALMPYFPGLIDFVQVLRD